jgi:hypothetical protein
MLNGGCNCHSIRYRITVPPLSLRPKAPYHTPGANLGPSAPTIPCVFADHCNDCRSATSSVLPMAFVADTSTVEISFLMGENVNGKVGTEMIGDEQRMWAKLEDVVVPLESEMSPASPIVYGGVTTTLGLFLSSPNRYRWFCTRCGTPLGYSVPLAAQPPFWKEIPAPRMFDIWLGTFDRDVLENEWMRPEKVMWTHFGITWVRELSKCGLPDASRHPLPFIDQGEGKEDEEEVKTWLKLLSKE